MVSIQIYGTDDEIEIIDESITYIKTAGDLGSITKINSSFSWTFKLPKSPNNTKVFDGLGLVGSDSRSPYKKIYCNVIDNGFPIVIKGLLNIKDTGENYNAYIQEGFIDLIKAINNDTIGEGLDLSELDHQRNYSEILNSFDLSKPFAYLICDVNGAFFPNFNGNTNLDPRYMSPFANVGYIFDLIFSTYGWTYTASQKVKENIEGTWMTYPSEIVLDSTNSVRVATITSVDILGDYYKGGTEYLFKIPLTIKSLDSNFVVPLNTNDKDYVIQATGDYEFIFASTGRVVFSDPYGNKKYSEYSTVVIKNGSIARNLRDGGSSDGTIKTHQFSMNAGDVVSLGASFRPMSGYEPSLPINLASMEIYNISSGGEVSFTKALIKLKISDFLKEVMTRNALTAFTDSENKHIEFLTLDERISQESVDWSNRYIERTRESYLYLDYDQKNWMRHKYEVESDEFNDGSLSIDNENLDLEKTIYKSISFSPSRNLSTFSDQGSNYKVPRLPMFDVEIKKDKDTGDLIGTYKFKDGRFFFVKAENSSRTISIQDNEITGFPLANINGNIFKDIVFLNYRAFENLSESAKLHDIDLALPLSDIISLDLKKLYYFDQEAGFYILNKLTYKSGEKSKGEFLRVAPKRELGAFSNAFSGAFNI